MKQYANILLLGQTGAGKSSLINYLAGAPLCAAGTGRPITQEFKAYEVTPPGSVPLRIMDSRGLEVQAYGEIRNGIENFLRSCSGSSDIHEWVHSVFYVLNVETGRLLPAEADFIRSLRRDISQSVHVVLTHCRLDADGSPDAQAQRLERHILEQLGDTDITVCCVNSVQTETRATSCPPFGRDELLQEAARLLWQDISRQTAGAYARELRAAAMHVYHQMCWAVEESIDQACRVSAAKLASGGGLDLQDKLDRIEKRRGEQTQEVLTQLHSQVRERLSSLEQFAEPLGITLAGSMTELEPERLVRFDGISDLDDGLLKETAAGRFTADLAAVDRSDFWQLLGGMFRGLGGLLTYRQILHSTGRDIRRLLRRRLPDEEQLSEKIYAILKAVNALEGGSADGSEETGQSFGAFPAGPDAGIGDGDLRAGAFGWPATAALEGGGCPAAGNQAGGAADQDAAGAAET